MELYLIRHAQSFNNALDDIADRLPDPYLTELGHQQAAHVAEYFASGINRGFSQHLSEEVMSLSQEQGFGITKLYCSAMYRAMQTAHYISEALDLPARVLLDIHEYGGLYLLEGEEARCFPGKTRTEILAEFPQFVLPPEITESGWWQGGREDFALCHARAIRLTRRLWEWAATEERIAIVTHGGFMDVLIKALLNQMPTRYIFYHHFNTAISRIDFVPQKKVTNVWYLNRVDHLPPELVS